jgi:hypothetical protein
MPPPSIASLSPSYGPVGATINIYGSNFGSVRGSSTVTFNGTAATPTYWSASLIVAPVPVGATTGYVVVTVNGLPSGSSGYSLFTVTVPPPITLTIMPSAQTPVSVAPGGTASFTITASGATPNQLIYLNWMNPNNSSAGFGCSGIQSAPLFTPTLPYSVTTGSPANTPGAGVVVLISTSQYSTPVNCEFIISGSNGVSSATVMGDLIVTTSPNFSFATITSPPAVTAPGAASFALSVSP